MMLVALLFQVYLIILLQAIMDNLEPVINSLSSNWILHFYCQTVHDTSAYTHIYSSTKWLVKTVKSFHSLVLIRYVCLFRLMLRIFLSVLGLVIVTRDFERKRENARVRVLKV